MKTLCIFIHGFNVWDGGQSTVSRLTPFFNDPDIYCVTLNYGHFGILETRFKNDKVAKRLHETIKNTHHDINRVIVIGHSNGCAIIHRAAEKYGTKISKAVYINPALKHDIKIPPTIKNLDVWHSESDNPVRWAVFLPASNARPWGAMGARGYSGNCVRVRNFDKENDYRVRSKEHSDVFKAEKVVFFGPVIAAEAFQ